MLNLILFGPPGSGKGTQAAKLVEKYNLLHISTGDLFRFEIGNKTELGLKAQEFISKGELVPDEITIGMLENKVNKHPEAQGIILDGFPRNVAQSKALDLFFKGKNTEVSLLIELKVEDQEIIKRITQRGQIENRVDDQNPVIVQNRINVYKNQTTPVANYYAEQGKAKSIDGVGSVEDIFRKICAEINAVLV